MTYRAMRIRAMRGHFKIAPMVIQPSAKKPMRRKKRTSRQSCASFSTVNRSVRLLRVTLARLFRVTSPTSCPESRRRRSSPLEDRCAHPP